MEEDHPIKRWIIRLVAIAVLIAIVMFALVLYAQWRAPTDLTLHREPPHSSSVVYSSIRIATSTDLGAHLTVNNQTIFDNATEPDLVVLDRAVGEYPAGTVLMYFTDYSSVNEEDPKISLAASSDGGKSWSEPTKIALRSDIFFDPISPSVVQLPDGTLRLFFTGFLRSFGAIAKQRREKITFSATSSDGINFTVEDESRIKGESFYDPELVWTDDHWSLFIGRGGQTLLNVSDDDGWTFHNISKVFSEGGAPGAINVDEQTVLFACFDGLVRAVADDTKNFSEKVNVLKIQQGTICDPSPAILPDGTMLLAYSYHE